jgi:DNA-binding XRE family transcriptional regulator
MAAPTAAPRQGGAKSASRAPARPLNHDPAAVREAREARGITQAGLAARIDRSHTYISEIEGGTRDARPELLQLIAEALEVNYALLERPRVRAACADCGHQYEPSEQGRTPLHLRGDGGFCNRPTTLADVA